MSISKISAGKWSTLNVDRLRGSVELKNSCDTFVMAKRMGLVISGLTHFIALSCLVAGGVIFFHYQFHAIVSLSFWIGGGSTAFLAFTGTVILSVHSLIHSKDKKNIEERIEGRVKSQAKLSAKYKIVSRDLKNFDLKRDTLLDKNNLPEIICLQNCSHPEEVLPKGYGYYAAPESSCVVAWKGRRFAHLAEATLSYSFLSSEDRSHDTFIILRDRSRNASLCVGSINLRQEKKGGEDQLEYDLNTVENALLADVAIIAGNLHAKRKDYDFRLKMLEFASGYTSSHTDRNSLHHIFAKSMNSLPINMVSLSGSPSLGTTLELKRNAS